MNKVHKKALAAQALKLASKEAEKNQTYFEIGIIPKFF